MNGFGSSPRGSRATHNAWLYGRQSRSGVQELWASLPRVARGVATVVIVPARNEAVHLPATLAALAAQVDSTGRRLDRTQFEVLLLANNCDDDSAAIARRFAAGTAGFQLHVVEASLSPADANIGFVRRQLMDAAAARLESNGRPEGSIVSTDADTRVAPDWLAAIGDELTKGVDAVGGRILTDGAANPSRSALRIRRVDAAHSLLRSRLASLIDPEPFDPWPRHHQHFGASLAVTARAYRLAGGVPDVPYLEDEALVRALERCDLRVRRSPRVRVVTSSRLEGRAAVGLSWQLRQWADAAPRLHDPLVEHPRRYCESLAVRAHLRGVWTNRRTQLSPDAISTTFDGRLGLKAGAVGHAFDHAQAFGAMWATLEQQRANVTSELRFMLPISEALPELRRLIRSSA